MLVNRQAYYFGHEKARRGGLIKRALSVGGIKWTMRGMNSTLHFSIKYDGPALAAHQMDVRELAPALIALSDLLEAANKAAFPNAPDVQVKVNGDFKGGSFGVDLTVVQTVAQQIVSLLSGPEVSASANLFGIAGGLGLLGSGGLIALVKWLAGRRPSSIRQEGDKTVFELTTAETVETLETDLITGKLYQTRVVRQALAKVVAPLERQGIDTFFCGPDKQVVAVVEKEELPWFTASASEADVVSDSIQHAVLLQIESAVFKDGNKWRMNDGSTAFYAEMCDAGFQGRVDAGLERFGKGDILVVDLRRLQTVTDGGLRTEWSIVQVLEHREPLQGKLGVE